MKKNKLAKELIESENSTTDFLRICSSMVQKILCKVSIFVICIQMEKDQDLDKDDPIENTGQMQSSFKDNERKSNENLKVRYIKKLENDNLAKYIK